MLTLGRVLYADVVWLQSTELCFALLCSQLLIGFECGVVVLWDLKCKKADYRYNYDEVRCYFSSQLVCSGLLSLQRVCSILSFNQVGVNRCFQTSSCGSWGPFWSLSNFWRGIFKIIKNVTNPISVGSRESELI